MALSIGGFVCDFVDILNTVFGTLFHLQNLNILNMYKVIYQNVDNAGFKVMFYELFLNTKQNIIRVIHAIVTNIYCLGF